MDERHAAETAALEQRERDAAGPQAEATNILESDLYSFTLTSEDGQKQVMAAHMLWTDNPANFPATWILSTVCTRF